MKKSTSTLKAIKSAVLAFLPDAKILLFGSRVIDNYRTNSDYDILVISEVPQNIKEKITYAGKIRNDLAKIFIDVDVLVKSGGDVEIQRTLPGHIVKSAMNQSIVI
jgi:predicted nucleotidyltransferase